MFLPVKYNPEVHHRRSFRLASYDYRDRGAYFVTICTYERTCVLDDPEIALLVRETWEAIPDHFPNAATDEFVAMPNHVHGIIWITNANAVGAHHDAPLRLDGGRRPVLLPGSLGAIVLQFKAAATKRVNELRASRGATLWQRNYYERVLRGERELQAARQYIRNNPFKWDEDRNNPRHLATNRRP